MNKPKSLVALGASIRRLRSEKGWSQEELAEKAGLHRNYVSSTERGERNISAVNIVKIAKALGVSGAELLKSAGI